MVCVVGHVARLARRARVVDGAVERGQVVGAGDDGLRGPIVVPVAPGRATVTVAETRAWRASAGDGARFSTSIVPSRRASIVRSTARSSPSAASKRGRLTLSVQFGGSDGQRRGER